MKSSLYVNTETAANAANISMSFTFTEYSGGYDEFFGEFKDFFADPRRFTYTPLIICRGTATMLNIEC